MRATLVAAIVVVVSWAGCLGTPSAPEVNGGDYRDPREIVWGVLDDVPEPVFSATNAAQNWEDFLLNYPKRDWALPHNSGARDYLRDELQAHGYQAEIMTLKGDIRIAGQIQQRLEDQDVHIVRGVLPGADDSRRIALVAHYDTVTATLQGAYDDGAGTIAQLEICKLLATVQDRLEHTIECLFFDAEEKGLVASGAYVDWYQSLADRDWDYELVFGYDMTGINWPGHAWDLYAMIGTEHDDLVTFLSPFHDFLEITLHEYFDANVMPGAKDGITVFDRHARNSDEMRFKAIGIPVVRFAGGEKADDYPMYHEPGDVVPYVYDFVGGRENFEKGYEAIILASYYTIQAFDAFDPWDLPTN